MPLCEGSERIYWNCVRQLGEHFQLPPDQLSVEQIRQYFLHLKCVKKVVRQTSTTALCAIKLFWEKTLQRP